MPDDLATKGVVSVDRVMKKAVAQLEDKAAEWVASKQMDRLEQLEEKATERLNEAFKVEADMKPSTGGKRRKTRRKIRKSKTHKRKSSKKMRRSRKSRRRR